MLCHCLRLSCSVTSRNRGPKVKIQKCPITVTTEEKEKCRTASMSCVSDRRAAQFRSRFEFNFLIVFKKMCPKNSIITKPTMAKAPRITSVAPSKIWSTVKCCLEMSSINLRSLPNLLMKPAMYIACSYQKNSCWRNLNKSQRQPKYEQLWRFTRSSGWRRGIRL